MPQSFDTLVTQGKLLSGLTPEFETRLKEIAPVVVPHLQKVTDAFYIRVLTLPATCDFLEPHIDRLDDLKQMHLNWLTSLFILTIDAEFATRMVKVSDAHAGIQLPLEFMVGAIFLMNKQLIGIIVEELGDDKQRCAAALQAVNSVMGFTLIIMQQSYKLWD
jgi:hypothetical protein